MSIQDVPGSPPAARTNQVRAKVVAQVPETGAAILEIKECGSLMVLSDGGNPIGPIISRDKAREAAVAVLKAAKDRTMPVALFGLAVALLAREQPT